MQGIVKTILTSMENAGAVRVTGVQLELGVSGHFTEEAVRQYFRLLTRETPVEGASLLLSWLPATYQCLSCQSRFESTSQSGICPRCGDIAFEISHQDACHIREIDVLFSEVKEPFEENMPVMGLD